MGSQEDILKFLLEKLYISKQQCIFELYKEHQL